MKVRYDHARKRRGVDVDLRLIAAALTIQNPDASYQDFLDCFKVRCVPKRHKR